MDDSFLNILDGRALADKIRTNIKNRVFELDSVPGLAVILIGNDPASHIYVDLKEKACEEAGIYFEKHLYFATVEDEEIIEKIRELNARDDINGILVQLPLPNQNADKIIEAIDPDKDVDGFHPESLRRFDRGEPALISAVALGIMKLIEASGRSIAGLKAVLVSSELFAHPITDLLIERGVHPERVPPDDPELPAKTKTADILIVAVGKPGMITGDMVNHGAIVIDVGTTRVDEQVRGDVDAESVKNVAGWLTPVPGGVGPMTVAMLLVNVLKAYQMQKTGKARPF